MECVFFYGNIWLILSILFFYRVVFEECEVIDMVFVIEYVDIFRIERVFRVIIEDVEERICVFVIREVLIICMVEVFIGK